MKTMPKLFNNLAPSCLRNKKSAGLVLRTTIRVGGSGGCSEACQNCINECINAVNSSGDFSPGTNVKGLENQCINNHQCNSK